jgi:aminopeptidase C
VWVESVKWLADKLMESRRDKKASTRDQWDRVAAYFEQLASCLESMLVKFKASEIPRIEGNQLNTLISHFAEVVHSIYSKDDDKDRETTHAMLSELYQTSQSALYFDMNMPDDYYEKKYQDEKHEFFKDLERTIGRYLGLAAALRASVPE